MIIKTLAVGPIQANCYILGCEETLAAAVIDPGDETDRILHAPMAILTMSAPIKGSKK